MLISLIIREMHIKTTMSYHLSPVRMVIINKSTNNVGEDAEKREPLCTIGGNADQCSHCGKQCGVTSENGTAFWPNDSTSWNLSKEIQNANLKEYMHLYVHCSVIYNSQDLEAAQVSISGGLDKTIHNRIHLHNRIVLGHKNEANFTLCDSMDVPGEHYAKWNKSVREK